MSLWPARQAAMRANAGIIVRNGSVACVVGGGLAAVTSAVGVGLVAGKLLALTAPIVLAVALRMGVLSPALRTARQPARRVLLRWIPRLLWMASLAAWPWAAVPFVAPLLGPALVAAQTLLVLGYAEWTVTRELRGAGPHPIEWLVLCVGLAAVVAFGLALLLVGGALAWFVAWWQGA